METRRKWALTELQSLQSELEGEIKSTNGVFVLEIDPKLGEGLVHCTCFDEGLLALEFDLFLNKDRKISLNKDREHLSYFFYVLKGKSHFQIVGTDKLRPLEELQTAVVKLDENNEGEITILKNEPLILNVIAVDKDRHYAALSMVGNVKTHTLNSFWHALKEQKDFFHTGRLNLEIGELIKQLAHAKLVNNIAALMHFRGICQLILEKHISQFVGERDEAYKPASGLLKRELLAINELSDFIKNYPELPHNLKELTQRSGLSAAKLQQGFKFLFDQTVGEYVRDVRLIKSEVLIRTTDMNISEVVYSIGLTSRSYFCKIFKQKYKCSPKFYKNNSLLEVR